MIPYKAQSAQHFHSIMALFAAPMCFVGEITGYNDIQEFISISGYLLRIFYMKYCSDLNFLGISKLISISVFTEKLPKLMKIADTVYFENNIYNHIFFPSTLIFLIF